MCSKFLNPSEDSYSGRDLCTHSFFKRRFNKTFIVEGLFSSLGLGLFDEVVKSSFLPACSFVTCCIRRRCQVSMCSLY